MKQTSGYDVIVIGGGPAGMMAAGRAAECGARVLLLEKNDTLGRKLLLTGGGRCNLTNATFDKNIFLSKFRGAVKFLHSPLAAFGVRDTLDFFASHGVPTKIEAENRAFPVSDDAKSVLSAFISYMREGGVEVRFGSDVVGLDVSEGIVRGVRLKNGPTLRAHAFIIATGGKSHPETGSTGDGFVWLSALAHTVVAPRPALVPIRIRESWVHALSGVSFAEAKLTVLQDGKRKESGVGKILFTHFGLSGPLVLNMSKSIGSLLEDGEVTLSVDLYPNEDVGAVDARLREAFDTHRNRHVKNVLDGFAPPLCIEAVLQLAGIDPESPVHTLRREDRFALTNALKGLQMTVEGLLGADQAIITSGGVDPCEVDFSHMRSRLHPNLYLVGDILDIDRPSGGYSLQLCWTTGYVAGTAASTSDSR